MKNLLALLVLSMLVPSRLAAADASAEVKAAARRLAEQPSYSWTSTPKYQPELPGLSLSPTEGKTEKDGYTSVVFSYNDNEIEMAFKGGKGAIKLQDEWNSESDLEGDREWIAQRLKKYKAAAGEAEELVGNASNLKKGDDGVVTGNLKEEAVKEILGRLSRRAASGAKDLKGAVKFWLKDGLLAKYEFSVQATVTIREEEMSVNLTTTVEPKDVGKTKVSLPDEAKKKLS